jgi:hypothetical protein
MPFGMILGSIGSAVIGDAVGSMFGGGSSAPTGGNPNAYVPTARPQYDQSFQDNYNAYASRAGANQNAMDKYIWPLFQQQMNNPYAGGFQQNANAAGHLYDQQVALAKGAAGRLYDAGTQMYQLGMDPRQSQYNMARDQLVDNTRAGEYARGISMTPYGAAVEGNVLGQFQNDWQNQQLQRAQMGLQGMEGAYRGGSALGNTAAQMRLESGQVPYDASNTVFGNQNQAINQYWASQQPYMQALQQLQSNSLGYINGANQAANQAFNNNMASAQQANQFAQQFGGPVSQAINSGWNWLQGGQSYNPGNYSTPFDGGDTYYGTGQNWGI